MSNNTLKVEQKKLWTTKLKQSVLLARLLERGRRNWSYCAVAVTCCEIVGVTRWSDPPPAEGLSSCLAPRWKCQDRNSYFPDHDVRGASDRRGYYNRTVVPDRWSRSRNALGRHISIDPHSIDHSITRDDCTVAYSSDQF